MTDFKFKSDYIDSPKTKTPIGLLFKETVDNMVIFVGEHMEVLIPYESVERGVTTIHGSEVEAFGIFKLLFWKADPTLPNTPPDHTTRFINPVFVRLIPHSIEKRTISGDPMLVLTFLKNNIFIKSKVIAQSLPTVKQVIRLVFESFLPKFVKYEEFVDIFVNCGKMNGVNFGVNNKMVEMIIAELARSTEEPMKPLRKVINEKGLSRISSNDYYMSKLSDLPHLKSTFTSISFQNIDYSIAASAKRHRYNEKVEESPVEKILKY